MTKKTESKATNLPINPTDLLKKQLAEANTRIDTGTARRVKIGVQGFTDPEGNTGDHLEIVIIDYTNVHQFYTSAYDPDNIVPPDCYANNRVHQELAPVKEAPSPQADQCAVCPQNRFGSAPNGKAKACRNSRLLAVLPANNLKDGPLWTFSVSPTATGRWDAYVRELMRNNLTPMFAVTKVTFEVRGTYASPVFSMAEPLNTEGAADAMARLDEAREILDLLPDWNSE